MPDDCYLSMEAPGDSTNPEAKKTADIFKILQNRTTSTSTPDIIVNAYQTGLNRHQIEVILKRFNPDHTQDPENFILWLAEIYRFPASEFIAAITNLQSENTAYQEILAILNNADDELKQQRNYAAMTSDSSIVGNWMLGGLNHTTLDHFRYRYTDKKMRETGGVYRELYKACAAREEVYGKRQINPRPSL